MTTSQMITLLKKKASTYDREDLLSLINDVQNFLFSRDCAQFLYKDPDTGLPPLLTTTGVRFYSFPEGTYPVDVRSTSAILARSEIRDYGYGGRWEGYYFANTEFYQVPVTSNDKTPAAPASVTFLGDGVSSSREIYHLFYRNPAQLVSESVQLEIPSNYHLQVRKCVLKLIEDEEYGRDDAWEYIENVVAKRIWYQMNRGAQGRLGRTLYQPEFRDYATNRGSYGRRR